jgi:hypothetical protein
MLLFGGVSTKGSQGPRAPSRLTVGEIKHDARRPPKGGRTLISVDNFAGKLGATEESHQRRSSATRALALRNSSASKPSVNQPKTG